MNTERMTVTAADLQPGDRIVRGPGIAETALNLVRVKTFIRPDHYGYFYPDDEFVVDRPLPTATLTFDVPESKREAVEQAVQRVLTPPVKVGDRVRRTATACFDQGWQHERGATGTVEIVTDDGHAWVFVDGAEPDRSYPWRAGSFEVVPS